VKALAEHGPEASGGRASTTEADDAARLALNELPEALLITYDEDLRVVLAAGQVLERLGRPPAYRPGEPLEHAFPTPLWSTLEPLLRSGLEGETRSREIWTEDERCVAVDIGPLQAEADEAEGGSAAGPVRGMAVMVDATERRRAELLAARDGFEEVFERAPLGTGLLDLEGRWMLVNRALCDITGYTSEELVGKRFDGIVHPDDAYAVRDARTRLLAAELPALTFELRYFDASGETVAGLLAVSLVRDGEGAPVHFIAQLQDVSERRELEDQLRRLADHDELTGLRSRGLFLNDLHLQVARCRRYGEVAGLMVIDVDGMRALNSEHGRDAGDTALTAVARALTRRLRQTDLVARVGGDEFAVLLPHIDAEGLSVVVEGIERVVPACGVDVGTTVLHPRALVGATLIDELTADAQSALDAAVRSMHGSVRQP
jgi:diguanylate cyclase (GGDEF)-like protein/PAS domain S-box-containing protein